MRRAVDTAAFDMGARPRTLSELIQARFPGVSVLRLGGDPSEGSRVRVRGTTSIFGATAPIVVVDGIPVETPEALRSTFADVASSRFDDFDPEEIEQVDVLSGPAATTMFGVGASNGAIVITTKRASTGRLRWRAWADGGISSEPTEYPANYRRTGTDPTFGGPALNCDVQAIANQQCIPATLDVWNPLEQASPFRSGRLGAGGLSIEGGPLGIKSFASAVARTETSTLGENHSSRANTRINLERDFGPVTVEGNFGYVYRHATIRDDHPVDRGLRGTAVDDANRGYLATFVDSLPLQREGDRLTRGLRAEWRARSWLRLSGVAGRDELWQRDHDIVDFGPGSGGPQMLLTRQWLASSIAHVTADASLVRSPWLTGTSVVSWEESHRRSFQRDSSAGGGTGGASESFTIGGHRSWMLQERLAFWDNFHVNAGARWIAREKSNGDGRWHPSVDAVWSLPRLFDDATMRLRGAYAVGVASRSLGTLLLVGVPPGAPPIEPERPQEVEFGLDATFGRRVAIDATFFAQKTPNLFMLAPAPPSSGFPGIWGVLGEMKNRGVEITSRLLLLDQPSIRWAATATFATLRNRVFTAPQVPPAVFEGAGFRDEQPFGVFLQPPITFVDANGDNLPASSEITVGQPIPNGTAIPTREISFRSNLESPRARLAFGATLDHRSGHRALNIFGVYQCRFAANCRALEDPGVSLEDKVTSVAARYAGAGSMLYLENASYTRISDVALRWRPPARFGRMLGEGAVLSFEARNLYVFSNFSGPDPEVATANARGGQPLMPVLPALPRTYSLRIDLR